MGWPDKILKEEKNIFLLGDLNINLQHRPTNYFLNSLASSSLLPYIFQLARLTGHSKVLIDNIFFNLTSHVVISGHMTAAISDHLLIAPDLFANPSSNNSRIFENNGSNFNQEKFYS